MIRQSTGFALFGSLLALLGAAAIQGQSANVFATYVIVGGSDLGDWSYLEVAAGGAILGLLVGATLWLVGLRTVGATHNRIARVTAAGLLGTAIGMSPTLVLVGGAFNDATWARDAPIFVVYPVSAVLAYVLSLAAVFAVLRIVGDESATATTKATAALLPVGGVIATLAGVGAAYRFDYSTTTPTWIVVLVLVIMVLAATFATGRAIGMRGTQQSA
ncbi:hypothetical protein GOEFS_106_00380 [Gordonia effusa NBRC 100432]|uniref:Uncharacterized protein n=1 Tax=Gordonia effusa NBRC 100432 TaxID=1077974 RepID=H0R4Z1_9ACTN|nr:hypothetical protein [Gordonia effusa]GAB20142.1 hypothetical protein GOEFS_106_00380 [Gordonia effusa NBRC 100432]